MQRSTIRLTVDSPQDLWVARIIHEKLGNKLKPISLRKIIKLIDDYPEIAKINENIPIGVSRIWN